MLKVLGYAFRDDYKVGLNLDWVDRGFFRTGWEQYRKYYDDIGVYYHALANPTPRLGEDLHLDIGRAWVELMRRLGYTRFVAQGGDWGGMVADVMGVQAPPELLGIT